MTPLTSTIADLTAAKLIAYVPPPAPGIALVAPSTDAALYMANPSYLKQLNQQAFQRYAVDQPNANAAARFDFASKTWEQSGKNPTAIPQWPVYSYLDQRAFDEWWNAVNSNLGQDAPPLFFIKLLPVPPPVQLVATDAPPAPPPAYDGPVGAPVPNNPGVFNAASGDRYPDGYIYAGPTGIYQKHVYSNPFTSGNVRIIWMELTPSESYFPPAAA